MTTLTSKEIAAVVVLYRPDETVLDNLRATQSQVSRILAVDNTEAPDDAFVGALQAMPGVEHIWLGGNQGIATALNTGLERASASGFAWALTLDQDSTPEPEMVSRLAACAGSCDLGRPLGVVSPIQQDEGGPEWPAFLACRNALTVITSGDLVSIDAWRAVGGFDDSLFIDQVDHDFCLKLHLKGFAVLRCGAARLLHRVGQLKEHRFPRRAYTTGHSPLRRYYIVRNRFIVSARYGDAFPEFRRREMRALRRELLKIALFEDHRLAKLRMSLVGYLHYRRGITGRYPG